MANQPESLEGLQVVVDGFNLQLPFGTGIKNYGLTLIEVLCDLGANVKCLHSAPAARDPILSEIVYYDAERQAEGFIGKFRELSATASLLARGILHIPVKTHPIPFSSQPNIVIPPRHEGASLDSAVINLPHCYRTSEVYEGLFNSDLSLRLRDPIDVWHATYPLPLRMRGARTITTIHDLIPFRLPYLTLDSKGALFRRIARALRNSDAVITVSEASRRDLAEIFGYDPERIHVTYQPVPLAPLTDSERDRMERVLASKGPIRPNEYILFTGTIETRKNVRRLLEAFALIKSDIKLVLVGRDGWNAPNELHSLQFLKNKVVRLPFLPTDDLRPFYAGARAFVFPSLYEGFGLPPLEAMTFGVPVIASRIPALTEVCGDAAVYADPYDVDEIADRIREVLENDELSRQLVEAGKKRVAFFSVENYKQRLLKAYRDAIA